MRAEDRWPGRYDDDRQTRHNIAALTSRYADGGNVLPMLPRPQGAMPEPIDADYEEISTPDGGVIIRLGGSTLVNDAPEEGTYNEDFYRNLAEGMEDGELADLVAELLEGIESDISSMAVWMANYQRGMSMLGTEQKAPRAEATGEGVSVVDHPLLLEACILYQSNACAEELPASGPVKIDNGGQSTAITDEDAKQLEKDFNKYLTVFRPEYYPDTERAIFQRGFGGMSFKKLFHCPIRRAPVSDSVAPGDFIVSNNATSLDNCERKTHRIKMRRATMKRMQFVGAYRDIDLATPYDDVTGIERKTKALAGIKASGDRQEDYEHTVYECCVELDLPGDRHTERGKPTGLPRPYIVTIEKDSRQILEIRRNWIEEDELFTERRRFVASSFLPMFGFFATGLLGVLGNTTSAVTAGWRIMCDRGMFANFPGGMYAKNGDRQLDNNFRAAPGEFVPVDISGFDDIRKVVQAYPYAEPGPASQAFFKDVAETGARVGGAANIPVAEGKADTPVGTMLAALEQTSKMISAVHRRSHQAQSLEFQTLLELIREKPEDFVKYFERDGFWTVERLMRALNNWSLIPRADPNTPTQMHRLLKMMALKQLQQLSPGLYDERKVDEIILRTLGFDDPQELFAPPAPAQGAPQSGPDPTVAIASIVAQSDQMKEQNRAQIEAGKGQLKLLSDREKIAAQAALQKQKDDAAMERELVKLGGAIETKQMEQQHAADEAAAGREHDAREAQAGRDHTSSESAATRDNAVKMAKMKPASKPGGKK